MSSSPPFSSSSGEVPGTRSVRTPVLLVLSGARRGHRAPMLADFATIGRHPSSDLQLDPERDLDVSARHAAVFRQGGGYLIRDLGSTNGTWINGTRIRADHGLEVGDRIQLGSRGPELEFQLLDADELAASGGPPGPASTSPPSPDRPRRDGPTTSTDTRIRLEVARQTDRLRRRLTATVVVLGTVVAGGLGWFGWAAHRDRSERAGIRDRLLREVDSLQAILMAASDEASGLRLTLDSAEQRTFALRQSVAGRDLDQVALAALDSQIALAVSRNRPLVRAARFDAAAVSSANTPALAMVFAEFDSTRRVSATGFVARTRADTAWLVTSRHAVTGLEAQPPARLGVAFHGSGAVYRARFVAADDSADVAVIRVVGRASQAITQFGSAGPVAPGDPVALIGFPLGLDLQPGDWQQAGISASTTTGTVSRVLPATLQLDGYGVAGASGSPVFTGDGRLVGVLSGGERDSGGRIIYAVPVDAVVRLLDRVAPVPAPRQP